MSLSNLEKYISFIMVLEVEEAAKWVATLDKKQKIELRDALQKLKIPLTKGFYFNYKTQEWIQ